MDIFHFFKKKEVVVETLHDFDIENPIVSLNFPVSYSHPTLDYTSKIIDLRGYICKKCGEVVFYEESQKNFINKNGCSEQFEQPKLIKNKKPDPIRWYN